MESAKNVGERHDARVNMNKHRALLLSLLLGAGDIVEY